MLDEFLGFSLIIIHQDFTYLEVFASIHFMQGVENKDEIGKLAIAFNQMSESLKKREKDLIQKINCAFSETITYDGFVFIGSSATGTSLIWKKDIDGVISLIRPRYKQVSN